MVLNDANQGRGRRHGVCRLRPVSGSDAECGCIPDLFDYDRGDGGVATGAQLAAPLSVAVDASGNLFIGDSQNYRIRMVNSSGIISTVAGNGGYGFSGDGSAAIRAQFMYIYDLAVDGVGNLYI